MPKKSRFLNVPIEPLRIDPALRADELLERMERISFQGRNLATAHRIWQKMLDDDVTIFLGVAGALSAGGLRMVIADLIERRYVDCLVSTGANLYHDLHETRGRHHYVGSPRVDDAELAAEGLTGSTIRMRMKRNSSITTTGSRTSPASSRHGPTRAVSFSIGSADICGRRRGTRAF